MSHAPDKKHIIDAKAAALRATVNRSKAAVVSASRELERHQLWVERNRALYTEGLEVCQRRLKRQLFFRACKQTALLPIQLLAFAFVAGFHWAWAYLHRFRQPATIATSTIAYRGRALYPDQSKASSPLTKCQTANDDTVDLGFRISGAVPDPLYRRIVPTSHPIDCIISPVNVDDNSASVLAAQLPLRHHGRRPAQKDDGDRTDYRADHEKCNGSDD